MSIVDYEDYESRTKRETTNQPEELAPRVLVHLPFPYQAITEVGFCPRKLWV